MPVSAKRVVDGPVVHLVVTKSYAADAKKNTGRCGQVEEVKKKLSENIEDYA